MVTSCILKIWELDIWSFLNTVLWTWSCNSLEDVPSYQLTVILPCDISSLLREEVPLLLSPAVKGVVVVVPATAVVVAGVSGSNSFKVPKEFLSAVKEKSASPIPISEIFEVARVTIQLSENF